MNKYWALIAKVPENLSVIEKIEYLKIQLQSCDDEFVILFHIFLLRNFAILIEAGAVYKSKIMSPDYLSDDMVVSLCTKIILSGELYFKTSITGFENITDKCGDCFELIEEQLFSIPVIILQNRKVQDLELLYRMTIGNTALQSLEDRDPHYFTRNHPSFEHLNEQVDKFQILLF